MEGRHVLFLLLVSAGLLPAVRGQVDCGLFAFPCEGVNNRNVPPGCCDEVNPVCCDRGDGKKSCQDGVFQQCCPLGTQQCDFNNQVDPSGFETCVPESELCDGRCCLDAQLAFMPCCGGQCCSTSNAAPCCGGACCKDNAGRPKTCCNGGQCCESVNSVCSDTGACASKCGTRVANNKTVPAFCPEPNVCCRGKCVDPIKGDPKLPCSGLCCNFNIPSTAPKNVTASTLKKNGHCCNNKCCTGSEKCCRGPDGLGCGTKCGTKCCRKGSKCCGGRCVSNQVYCGGLCCTGSKGQPAACCTNPKTGQKSCC